MVLAFGNALKFSVKYLPKFWTSAEFNSRGWVVWWQLLTAEVQRCQNGACGLDLENEVKVQRSGNYTDITVFRLALWFDGLLVLFVNNVFTIIAVPCFGFPKLVTQHVGTSIAWTTNTVEMTLLLKLMLHMFFCYSCTKYGYFTRTTSVLFWRAI